MPGILKKIYKNLSSICLITIMVIIVFMVYFHSAVSSIITVVVIGLFLVLAIHINNTVVSRNKSNRNIFGANSKIRNVDYLLIGDMISPYEVVPENKTYVQICCPNRTMLSCWELLRHCHSIIRDGGNVVVYVRSKRISTQEFSIFDVSYFHRITIDKYDLKSFKYMNKLPIIFSPINTIKLFINRAAHKHVRINCPSEDLVSFCNERGYSLTFLTDRA